MYPVPSTTDLASFSGRPEASYTAYASQALLLATLHFTIVCEVHNAADIADADDQVLARQAICSLADWLYLRQPYQATIANPLQSETIGSYTYDKASGTAGGGSMSRMAPGAMELGMETTGVMLYDLAVQMLSKRTRAGGVFSGSVHLFEEGGKVDMAQMFVETASGQRFILGPAEKDDIDIPFDVNSEAFPHDPGI